MVNISEKLSTWPSEDYDRKLFANEVTGATGGTFNRYTKFTNGYC